MSTYSNWLQPPLQNLLQHVVRFFHPRSTCKGALVVTRRPCSDSRHVTAPYKLALYYYYYYAWRIRFWQTKITGKASEVAENLQLYRVVWFFHPRSSCTTTHISADVQRITLSASCTTILGGRTKQLDIFCCVTGFTSDFLSFIVVELIPFFHGAIQLFLWLWLLLWCKPELR